MSRLLLVRHGHDFRGRVEGGLARIREATGPGETVAAFTSGGPVGAAVGAALDLSDEAVLELSFVVQNAACTEFLFSGERFSLNAFNTLPRLYGTELVTAI